MLCVLALERHGLKPGDGEVLVTGATGGVGSVAIGAAREARPRVVACATGKASEARLPDASSALAHVIDRAELAARRQAAAEGALGRASSTRSAATRWPTRWRRRATAAWSRPAAWRRAATCRAR